MESSKHLYLVELLQKWVIQNSSTSREYILVDRSSDDSQSRPPKIRNHTPDLYMKNPRLGEMIIGEAKTSKDIRTPRTNSQLTEFVSYVNHHNGLILVSVDLVDRGTARALIREIIRRENCLETRYKVITPLDV